MTIRERAEDTVIFLAIGGIVTAVLGAILAAATWPDDGVGDASLVIPYAFVAISFLGQIAVFVAVVACGVRLGVGWAGLLDPPPTTSTDVVTASTHLDEDGR